MAQTCFFGRFFRACRRISGRSWLLTQIAAPKPTSICWTRCGSVSRISVASSCWARRSQARRGDANARRTAQGGGPHSFRHIHDATQTCIAAAGTPGHRTDDLGNERCSPHPGVDAPHARRSVPYRQGRNVAASFVTSAGGTVAPCRPRGCARAASSMPPAGRVHQVRGRQGSHDSLRRRNPAQLPNRGVNHVAG